jgi:hypothetical protein
MQTQPAKKSEPWEKLKWSPCFMTHSMEKVHTDMIILVSEVIGSIIYETYKSLKNSYDTEVLRIMFSNEFLFGTVSEVFKLTYTMLSDELLQESFSKKTIYDKHGSQLYLLTAKILQDLEFFPKDVSLIYAFNASMIFGLHVLSRLDFSEYDILTKNIVNIEIAKVGMTEKEFGFVHYLPAYRFPVLEIIIK